MSNLRLEHIPAQKWWQPTMWRLLQDVTFDICEVPAGFTFDGASIPRVLWWLFSPSGRYMKAALLHDYLIETQTVSRAQSAQMFYKEMEKLGVILWRRAAIYWGVCLYNVYLEIKQELGFE